MRDGAPLPADVLRDDSLAAQLRTLAEQTDETVYRVETAWLAYCAGCNERKEIATWDAFEKRWRRDNADQSQR